jgi:hypothetical protein
MIKNLSQLKKALKAGATFEITAHCRPDCIGQQRQVTKANTQGFYSILPAEPQSKTSLANGEKGSWLGWSNAPFWSLKTESAPSTPVIEADGRLSGDGIPRFGQGGGLMTITSTMEQMRKLVAQLNRYRDEYYNKMPLRYPTRSMTGFLMSWLSSKRPPAFA